MLDDSRLAGDPSLVGGTKVALKAGDSLVFWSKIIPVNGTDATPRYMKVALIQT